MNSISIKSIKVFTDGTISISFIGLESNEQVIFHEKDIINSSFSQKSRTSNSFQNTSTISYKAKYKL